MHKQEVRIRGNFRTEDGGVARCRMVEAYIMEYHGIRYSIYRTPEECKPPKGCRWTVGVVMAGLWIKHADTLQEARALIPASHELVQHYLVKWWKALAAGRHDDNPLDPPANELTDAEYCTLNDWEAGCQA